MKGAVIMTNTKKFWRAALIRAVKTVCQTLVGMLPVEFMITPTMLQNADWNMLWVVLAWLASGLFSGIASILTSIVAGLPEVGDK